MRIIIVTGKGGVGKTSIAAANGAQGEQGGAEDARNEHRFSPQPCRLF